MDVTLSCSVAELCACGYIRSQSQNLHIPMDLMYLCRDFLGYSLLSILPDSHKDKFYILHCKLDNSNSKSFNEPLLMDKTRLVMKDSNMSDIEFKILKDWIVLANCTNIHYGTLDFITAIDKIDCRAALNDQMMRLFDAAFNYSKEKIVRGIGISPMKYLTKLGLTDCGLDKKTFYQLSQCLTKRDKNNNKIDIKLEQLTLTQNSNLFVKKSDDNRGNDDDCDESMSSMKSLCSILLYYKDSIVTLGLYDTGLDDNQCDEFFQFWAKHNIGLKRINLSGNPTTEISWKQLGKIIKQLTYDDVSKLCVQMTPSQS